MVVEQIMRLDCFNLVLTWCNVPMDDLNCHKTRWSSKRACLADFLMRMRHASSPGPHCISITGSRVFSAQFTKICPDENQATGCLVPHLLQLVAGALLPYL